MAHKTNYKDALFEQRKYRMQNNPDGTVTPIDETDYTQEGDRIGALELNEIGEALNALEQEMVRESSRRIQHFLSCLLRHLLHCHN